MNTTISVLLGIFCIVIVASYFVYASVIKRKNKVKEAFSCIDVQLKKRYDIIPNILTIANKYMDYEKNLLEELTKLRTEVLTLPNSYENIGQKLDLDNLIKDKMQQLLVSVENYPQLKADSTMVTAMQTYNEVEEHIAAARRFFNSAVNDLNNAVDIFPYSFFAKRLGISGQEFFKINEQETKSVNANEFLGK